MTAARAFPPTDDDDRPALASRVGRLDAAALARAQAALEALAGEFAGWMAEELAKLEAARDRLRAGSSRAAADALFLHAHDLKGLGTTYGHPFVTRLCASLCRLLGDSAHRSDAPTDLMEAHVAAVRAAADGEPEALTLAACEALERRVAAELAARRG